METAIQLAAGPGPGDAEFKAGKTNIHESKLLVDADLPFGYPVEPDETVTPPGPEAPPPAPPRMLLQPILDLRLGYCTSERPASEEIRDAPPGVRVRVDTAIAGLGLGVRIELFKWLHLEPRFTLVYGHSTGDSEGGDPVQRQRFDQAYDRTLVGWRSETFTLIPAVALRIDHTLGDVGVHWSFTQNYLRTLPFSTTSSLQDQERSSFTMRAAVWLDVPIPGLVIGGRQVYLMPSVGYSRMEGDLGRLPETGRNFFDTTLGIAPDLTGLLPLVGRLGLSVTYVRGENFEGKGWDVVWIVAF